MDQSILVVTFLVLSVGAIIFGESFTKKSGGKDHDKKGKPGSDKKH